MIKKLILASILSLASAPLLAANYYVVIPSQSKGAVAPKIDVTLSAVPLPAGMVAEVYPGFDFNTALSVTGDPTFSSTGVGWSLYSGELPAGLVLNPDGTVSGTPTTAQTESFQVQASYKSITGGQAYTITVEEPKGYLLANGVTVRCTGMKDGAEFDLNSKTYRVVYSKADASTYAATACTSNMTDMSDMPFGGAFNENISHWDTANVTNMGYMFYLADAFNQPIGGWDVSNVEYMYEMFYGAMSFNQPIGGWDVGNVQDMYGMFNGATSFNEPIGGWDVSNVQYMEQMFSYAEAFNQPIGDWDTSNIGSMEGMFNGATSFNEPIGGWDTSKVQTMGSMFYGATAFNQPIGGWDTSSATDMGYMFVAAEAFNQPIGNWDTSKVTFMEEMLMDANSFNQSICNWDVSASRGPSNFLGPNLLEANAPKFPGTTWGSNCP